MGTAKIIWSTKRGVSPACTPSIRQQYASVPYTPPIRRRHSILNGLYCSSNYLQSDRHTIYIEAIFVIVPVVFKHCCVHTNQFPFHLCRLVLFQPSAAWITLMSNRTACFRHAAGIRRIPFVLKSRGQSKLLKTGFCWASTMGSMYTEGSNFGLKWATKSSCF